MKTKIPWWYPVFGEEETREVAEVLKTGFVNDGEWTRKLEAEFARLLGIAHAVAVTSGTAALFLALKASEVGPGDEVIVPAFTFIATANAVTMTGAVPVFADVSTEDFNILPEEIDALVTASTRAIIVVHINGRRAALEEILNLARHRNLAVIEDAAQALGSTWEGAALGTDGRFGCYSLAPTKIITAGQGGLVVTRNAHDYQRLVELKDQGRPVRGTGGADEHPSIGFNFKLTNLQAALALVQMSKLDQRKRHLRDLYERYSTNLAHVRGIRIVPIDFARGVSPQWIDALCDDRDGLARFLAQRGIDSRAFYKPVPSQPAYCRHQRRAFTGAELVSRRGIWLPSNLRMTAADVDDVCEGIVEFYNSRRMVQ
jgi:perosamine synthetase